MAGENTKNFFEQPSSGNDNALNLGGTMKNKNGVQTSAIADVPTAGAATAAANATAINAILVHLRNTGQIAP